ncbi:MAG: hypothetical protein AAF216_01595 [Pseudomonadota bacterium]
MYRIVVVFVLASLAAACTTSTSSNDDSLTDAALSPFEDLNLRQEEIPPVLAALDWPYDPPEPATCATIETDVIQLSAALGQDIDFPPPDDERSRAEWATEEGTDAALGFVASEARGFIPFRGIVREATGANDYADRVARAIMLGHARRAYLKGIGASLGCDWPAAPLPPPLEELSGD